MHIDFISTISVIAATGCLTRAAEQLDVSPSTIHKRLKKVEDYYRTEVFSKVDGRLSLTDAGKSLLTELSKIERINNALISQTHQQKSCVHIGMNQGLGVRIVRDILSAQMKQEPELAVKISTIVDRHSIKHFQGDFFITTIPINDPDICSHIIGELTCYFVASLDYIAEHGEPTTLEELSQHNMILTSLDTIDEQHFYCEKVDGSKCKFAIKSSIYTDSKVVSDEFINNGNGIGLIPHTKLVASRQENIKVLFNGSIYSKVLVQIGTKHHQQMSPTATRIMELITDKLNSNYI
ncbi:LysR family transcriptional regulator [Shewanella youngdeokensis]|uniref:LysR family transcriptional regulator n=1 Tax=Shewanella youngdeokensis TaxID=2999068 RepID=A0ABZ0JYM2_9GAMM|nr:LysR family transcriptional regulator [Shewanella sp. DAU334]